MSIFLSVSALQAPQNNYGKLSAKELPLNSFYGSNTPKQLSPSINPLIKNNILASIKLSPKGNKALKDKYYRDVTKGVIPVEEGKKPFYHIVSALPAAGKSTVMRNIQKENDYTIPIERDEMIMLHPNVDKAIAYNSAKWARLLRKVEGLDTYADGEMIDRFMNDRYNITQGVVGDINKHIDKAKKHNYKADIHVVVAPKYVVKMRSMQRFLTSPEGSPDKRLVLACQYEMPKYGYADLQKHHLKKMFEKYPDIRVSANYNVGVNSKNHHKKLRSYDDFKQLLKHVNELPSDPKERKAFNKKIKDLRDMFNSEYPEGTNKMPEGHRKEALKLLQELPE